MKEATAVSWLRAAASLPASFTAEQFARVIFHADHPGWQQFPKHRRATSRPGRRLISGGAGILGTLAAAGYVVAEGPRGAERRYSISAAGHALLARGGANRAQEPAARVAPQRWGWVDPATGVPWLHDGTQTYWWCPTSGWVPYPAPLHSEGWWSPLSAA